MPNTTFPAAAPPASTLLSQSLEAFQTVEIAGNRVIISVLDTLAIGATTDVGSDYTQVPQLWIFAEDVSLAETFAVRNAVLSAHSLDVAAPPGVLDASGADGATAPGVNENADHPGPAGGDGEPGGTLCLYVESAGPYTPDFTLSVRGGNGGAGQAGTVQTPGSDGGNGGAGGHAVVVAGVPPLAWLATLRVIDGLSTPGARQAALRDLLASLPADDRLASLRTTLQSAAAAATGQALTAAMESAAQQLQVLASGFTAALSAAADVGGGAYGPYGAGAPNGANGAAGAPGTLDCVAVGAPADVAAAAFPPFFVAHPSQCARLLERARLMYLVLDPVHDPQGVPDLMALLLRLQARTDVFVQASATSELATYYVQNEARVGAVGSLQQMGALNTQAGQYLAQLRQGRDLFGNNGNYVPLASFGFYKSLLDELIPNFGVLEANYHAYFDALEKGTAQMDAVHAARAQQQQVMQTARSQLASLQLEAERSAAIIDGYEITLPPVKQALEDAIEAARADIDNAFSFSFDQLVQAVGTLAFAPESQFMMLVQAGQLLYNASTKVENDQGVLVNKSYIVSQIDTVQATVEGLTEGYQQLDNGTLAPDDPGAAKLVAQEAQLTSFLSQFSDRFSSDLQAVQQSFDRYVSQVVTRNNQILNYNATVLLMLNNAQLIAQGQQNTQRLNDAALAGMAPGLPDLVSYVSGLYYTARAQLLEVLSLTARAFRFWALSDADLLAQALGGRTPPEIDTAALTAAQSSILNAYRSAVEDFGTNASVFPAQPDQPGLVVNVPAWQVELIKESHQLMVQLPTVTPTTTSDQSVFAGMANVRVLAARAWIDGARTTSGTLHVDVTHTGSEQIVNPSGTVFSFSHEPVTKPFIYSLKSGAVVEDANFGVVQQEVGGAPTYAALGPFTTWQIKVDPAYNSGLDLSGVTGIRLEFQGTNFAFT